MSTAQVTANKAAFGRFHEAVNTGDVEVISKTHQGEYRGVPATGKSVTYNEIFVVRFAGSRIAEIWGVVDVLSQMKQLGLIPA
jgi:predicted ester cyclase